MKKVPIKIIKLGHIDKIIDFKYIQDFSSVLFSIEEITKIANVTSPQKNDGYLNIVYSSDEVKSMLSNSRCDSLCIAIMDYKFNDNFYMHRVGKNKICISISGVEDILKRKNISLENFILKNIYEIVTLHTHFDKSLPNEIYNFVHEDTRGCLFDLNGDTLDIIYNTEQPTICNECKSKLNQQKNIDIDLLQDELNKIKKPWVLATELFIKKNPLFSIVVTILFTTSINILSNYIWSWIVN